MPLNTQKVKALLFDVDGTLSDTDDQLTAKIARALHPLRFLCKNHDPAPVARWIVMFGETPGNALYTIMDATGLDKHLARAYNWLAHRKRRHGKRKHHYSLVPGVRQMLLQLYEHYPMAVVSARDALTTREFLDYFEIADLFTAIVTSQTCEHTKPFADPVIYAAQQLGVAPDECLMIGDTSVDVLAGKAAGAQTVAVFCGFGTVRELRRLEADLYLDNTAELAPVLLGDAAPD